MGGRPGMPPKETSPGGKALKYYASLRLAFKQIGNKSSEVFDPLTQAKIRQDTATDVRVKCTKNKVGNPFRYADVRVRYGRGFDNAWSALQVLVAHGRVSKTGAQYTFTKTPDLIHDEMPANAAGKPYLNGEGQVLTFADTHPGWRSLLIDEAVSVLHDVGQAAPEDEDNPLPASLTLGDPLDDL